MNLNNIIFRVNHMYIFLEIAFHNSLIKLRYVYLLTLLKDKIRILRFIDCM